MALNKRQAQAQAAVAQLRESFPTVFTPTDCRPLKIGVHTDLLALGFDREIAVIGLRSYCRSKAYLKAIRESAERIGLDGQRTGVVSAEEERIAASQLSEKKRLNHRPEPARLWGPPP
jgi:ProP effector